MFLTLAEWYGYATLTPMTKTEKDNATALYDLGYHLVDTISEEDLKSSVQKLKRYVEEADGTVVFEHEPRRISLAYPVSRSRKGAKDIFTSSYLGTLVFEIARVDVAAIHKALKADQSVFRFLLIETNRSRAEEAMKTKPDVSDKEKKSSDLTSDEMLDKTIEALTA